MHKRPSKDRHIRKGEYTCKPLGSSGLCAALVIKGIFQGMSLRLASFQPDIALNLGSMIRLSACFSVPIDVIEPCGFPFSVKALRRSAMDYADIADITRHNSWDTYLTEKPAGRIVLMTTVGATPLWDFQFQSGDTILMGRESAGVPDTVHDQCDAHIKLAMSGAARSLNVAMCAGMAVSEGLRQVR
jgi:tRNA (cytidine/uridine-2'-O-)-methyltransferase